MAFYRFYFIDADGHFSSADDGIFDNDADALVAAAAKLGRYSAIEVWTGSLLVGKVGGEAGEPSPAAPSG